jgi:hypothetical protein
MATTQPPLDPRKYPYHRGDVVTSGFKKNGFVLDFTPAYLEVMWMGTHDVERVPTENIDDLLRVSHAHWTMEGATRTNLQTLESVLALSHISNGIKARMATIKSDAEKAELDSLVKRAFNQEGCAWDRAHMTQLLQMVVEPSVVGMGFRLRERAHRLFCAHHKS